MELDMPFIMALAMGGSGFDRLLSGQRHHCPAWRKTADAG